MSFHITSMFALMTSTTIKEVNNCQTIFENWIPTIRQIKICPSYLKTLSSHLHYTYISNQFYWIWETDQQDHSMRVFDYFFLNFLSKVCYSFPLPPPPVCTRHEPAPICFSSRLSSSSFFWHFGIYGVYVRRWNDFDTQVSPQTLMA